MRSPHIPPANHANQGGEPWSYCNVPTMAVATLAQGSVGLSLGGYAFKPLSPAPCD